MSDAHDAMMSSRTTKSGRMNPTADAQFGYFGASLAEHSTGPVDADLLVGHTEPGPCSTASRWCHFP